MEQLDFRAHNADLANSGEMVPGTLVGVAVVHKPLFAFFGATVRLDVRVEPEGGAAYAASYLIHVPEDRLPAVGKRVVVFRDRNNPQRILVNPFVDDDEFAKLFNPEIEALLASAPAQET